jgi:hypothetical protein
MDDDVFEVVAYQLGDFRLAVDVGQQLEVDVELGDAP